MRGEETSDNAPGLRSSWRVIVLILLLVAVALLDDVHPF
jgi:hypothetical protein